MPGHVFARVAGADLPMAVRGEGSWIVDAAGRRYLDGSGGAAVSCLGHSDPEVRAAVHAQLDRIAFAHTGFFTSEPAEDLADLLAEAAPPGIGRVFLCSGGSEAVEAAIKLARQHALETGQPRRTRLIARAQSYHGNTLGALAAGGHAGRRAPYAPLLVPVSHIPPCYAYRHRAEGESDAAYGLRAADALEAEIERLGPETVLAFIAEPVAGATLGAVPPVPGYFRRIREICDRHGVLMILDEVMCGMGRTGHFFACAAEGVVPDIVTVAKGLGAGYAPIGAMLCTDAIHDAIAQGSGSFRHGHTYLGHPLAAAAGAAVVRAIRDRGLVARVARMGALLDAALRDAFGQHPRVGDIRGRGLLMALEFVADRATKAPFDPARGVAARLKAEAMAAGLIVYPGSGTADGVAGDHVLIAPPYTASETEIGMLVDRLATALGRTLG